MKTIGLLGGTGWSSTIGLPIIDPVYLQAQSAVDFALREDK